jgi:serine/threonine protein kinase
MQKLGYTLRRPLLGALTTPTNSPSFGSFTLLAKLARGDIGDLFLARSQGAGGFEKLVIIKRIHPEFMRDEEISNLFHTEAQLAARIEHPNVRIVYEIGSNDAHHYIALEYLEGVPLVDLLLSRKRERRLADPRLIASLISQACQGLNAAHKIEHRGRPLVHGDINPRSIFVTDSGTTKLLDFDIVEMRGALAKRHGFVRRTIAYMSPEEVRSDLCDRRSDIFSLGVVAWEAITGRRLFKQESRDRTLAAIDRGRIPNAKDLQGGISDALNATIMRSLSRDPSLRFQSAQDFGSAIDRAMLEEGPPLTPVAISTLIKAAFRPALETQREFVRAARKSQDGDEAAKRDVHGSFTDFEKPTVVAASPIDPDDWNSDDSATTVGGEELIAAIEAMAEAGDGREGTGASTNPKAAADPFKKISENADFSVSSSPPIWQDTRNLVLSEVEADTISARDDEEKTGAVVLPRADAFGIENYGLASQTAENEAPEDAETDDKTLPGEEDAQESTNQHSFGPPPALEAPLVAGPELKRQARVTSAPGSIYDRRLGTINPPPRADAEASLPTPEEPAPIPTDVRPNHGKARYVIAFLGTTAVVLAALLLLSSDKSTKPVKSASVVPDSDVGTKPREAKPSNNSGAGAAAGILAAANGSSDGGSAAEPVKVRPVAIVSPDAGPVASAVVAVQDTSEPDAGAKDESASDKKNDRNIARKKNTKTPEKSKTKTKTKTSVATSSTKTNSSKTPVTKTTKAPKTTGKGPGFLTVAASPYATVFVDGKKRGITPIVKLKLQPGVHRLKLVSSAGGKSKNMKVRITSGDVMRQNVRF